MIIRIELEDVATRKLNPDGSYAEDPEITEGGSGSGNEDGSGSGSESGGSGLPETGIRVTPVAVKAGETMPDGSGVYLAAYASTRFDYPVADLEFIFPKSDYERVSAWFSGDFSNVTTGKSDTLDSNMKKGVHEMLDAYYAELAAETLVGRPLKVVVAWRLTDGRRVAVGDPQLFYPDAVAPRLIVRNRLLRETSLAMQVEIRSNPCRLTVNAAAAKLPDEVRSRVTHVDVCISAGTPLYSKSHGVDRIATQSVDGESVTVISYESYPATTVEATLAADNDLRVVASYTVEELEAGIDGELAIARGSLSTFSSLPKLTDKAGGSSGGDSGGDSGGGGDEPVIVETHRHFMTEPLDLGRPEREKWVRGVILRGIYPRDSAMVTLYGSHHREHWRKLASARGGMLRRLRGVRYRWLQVEVDTDIRSGDRLDALTFDVALK